MDVCLFKYYFKNSPLVLYSSKVEMLSHVTHCFLCLQKHEQVKNVTYKFPVLFSTDTYSLYSVSVFQKTPEHVVGFFELNRLLHEFGVSKVFFSLICTIQQPDFLLYWTDKSLWPEQCSDVLWSHVLVEVLHLVWIWCTFHGLHENCICWVEPQY